MFKKSLVLRIVFLSALLAAIFLAATNFVSISYTRNLLKSEALGSAEKKLELLVAQLETRLELTRQDLVSISKTPPFNGIYRSRNNGGIDPLDGSTLAQWLDRLSVIFTGQDQSNDYLQLRFLDPTGKEQVRVNFLLSSTTAPQVVSPDNLQNKSLSDYFIQAQESPTGSIIVTGPNLNREGNPPVISQPEQPVLRYSIPLATPSQDLIGVLVANLAFDHLISNIVSVSDDVLKQRRLSIIDADGYYILHTDLSLTWGGPTDKNTGKSVHDFYPEQVGQILSNDSYNFETADTVVVSKKAFLDDNKENFVVFIQEINKDTLYASSTIFTIRTTLTGLAVFIILFFVFLSLIRRFLSPLKELRARAEKIGQGDLSVRATVHSSDEIGQLAHAFNVMAKKLQESYDLLETTVKHRTKELATKVKELEGTKEAMMNLLEDVDSEKAKVEALARDLEKYRLAVEGASDHIIITNKEGTILFANRAVEKITGFTVDEVLGHKAGARELWGGLMPKEFYQKMWHTISVEKRSFSGEIKNKRKNGDEYFAWSTISPILGNDGDVEFFIGIERDITHDKEIDKAKTEFVSLASHQLRTPLSSISWYAEMLLDGDAGPLNNEQKTYLQEVYDSNRRMVKLVNALLNVSRLDLGTFSVEPAEINLAQIAQRTIKELEDKITTKHLTIKANFASNVPTTYLGDENLTGIVFQNLISNAVKYTLDNGTVSVSMEKKDDCILLTVADTGMGIPANQQDKIFQKLFRADNVRQTDTDGTGLGLYIIKAIAEQIGGDVSFTSTEGQGTTFTFCFPANGMTAKKGSKKLD